MTADRWKRLALIISFIIASLIPLFPVIFADTSTTTVSVVNDKPWILRADINIYKNVGDASIDLSENTTVQIFCNATVYDNNGYGDISTINATLHSNLTTGPGTADDNNNHYLNTSCTLFGGSGTSRGAECQFTVWYYANNATWVCNMSVIDSGVNFNSSIGYKDINVLAALNVPATIDFGTVTPGQNSSNVKVNVTNTGNDIIDLSIYGYANNFTTSDNAMNCTNGFNISLGNMRYNVTARFGAAFCVPGDFNYTYGYWNLTNSSNAKNWTQFSLGERQNDALESRNETCWMLQVPVGAGGTCRGIVSFSAFVNEA